MAFLNGTGLETGDFGECDTTTGTVSVVSSPVRSGSYSGRFNPTTTAVGRFTLGGPNGSNNLNVANIYARGYLYITTLPAASSEEIMSFVFGGATYKMAVRVTSAGNLQAYDSSGTSQMGSDGATTLALAKWYLIEVLCGTGAAASWEIKIDGVSELSGTGNLATTNNGLVHFGKATNRNGQSIDMYWDDIALSDSAYPGAGAVARMEIDGTGAAATWTDGAGTWPTNVAEVPSDGNTSYILSTLTDGQASTGSLESTSSAGISGTINFVKPVARVLRDGAANGTFNTRVRSGGSNSDSADIASVSAYRYIGHISATDPSTAVAWTTTGLDSAEAGVVEAETTDRTRCSTIYLMVDFVAASGPPVGGLALMGVGR